MTAGVSRSGSTVMNNARVRFASGPSARKISDTSNKVVGQTSGQCVKPKNTRKGCPFKSWSVTTCPSWLVSLKGPPMAAICCATGEDRRPATIRTTPKQSANPARKAAAITRIRLLRAVMSDCPSPLVGSQAGGNPSDDHFVEHRRAVVGPERQRPGEHDPCRRREEHERTRKQGCRCRGGLGHQPSRVRPANRIGPHLS